MAGEGVLSPQYKSVHKKYASLTGLLSANEGTRENLTDQLTFKHWLAPGSSSQSSQTLINLALERIKYKATEYDDFITMLQQSGGANLIVDDLLGAA